ncbi:MMPL family transporter [Ottowia flava]|uniref:MMPL family transporter n=1 Tax=Ottowia flava TaxID=2675430 RepID=A0ABW4KP30_9BURK|nr:MMPL family transporter [Ottowia sp. GY511]
MSAFLPKNPDEQQRLLVDQIKDGALSRMVLMGIEGGDSSLRAGASERLAAALRDDAAFASVINGDAASRERDQTLLMQSRYLLSQQVSPERFSPSGLHAAIRNSINELGGSAGLILKSIFPRDPTGELPALIGRLTSGRAPAGHDGVWTSASGDTALLIAMTAAPGTDTDAQESVLARIRDTFERERHDATLKLVVSGAPVFSVDARQSIKSEVERLSLVGGISILLIMFAFYRSIRNMLIGLVPVFTGILVAVVAVFLGFETVHAITVGFGTTLLGETLDYSIYYLVQSSGDADWRRDYWPTVRLGVATSVCGFAALLFSSFPGLGQLGIYSIAGLLTAAAVTRFVLPSLPSQPVPASSIRWLGHRMAQICALAQGLRWVVAAAALVAVGVVATHHDRLWAQGLSGLNPAPRDLQKLDERLRLEAGAPNLAHMVVVSAPTADAALRAAEVTEAHLAPLLKNRNIERIDSPAHFLPSSETQTARRSALPDASTLSARLVEATAGLPVKAARLEPFIEDVETARSSGPITTQTLHGTSFEFVLQTLLLQRESGWSVLMPLSLPADPSTAEKSRQAIEAALMSAPLQQKAYFLDVDSQSTQMFGKYLKEALAFSAAGIVGIVGILFVSLRSPVRVLRVLMPLGAAVSLVMAGHVVAGTPMTLLHLVGLLLIVAVGSNYALFFDQRFSAWATGSETAESAEAPARAAALASLALANVSTMIGFGILAWSKVPVLHAIGSTVGPGALLALLLAMAWSRSDSERMKEAGALA